MQWLLLRTWLPQLRAGGKTMSSNKKPRCLERMIGEIFFSSRETENTTYFECVVENIVKQQKYWVCDSSLNSST